MTEVLPGNRNDSGRLGIIQGIMKIPGVKNSLKAHEIAGIRDRGPNEGEIYERNYRVASEHCLVVSLVCNELANLLDLDEHDRNLLVNAAILHDSTKRIEMMMMDYINRTKKEIPTEKEEIIISKFLDYMEIPSHIFKNTSEILSDIKSLDSFQFSKYFDQNINTPFIQGICSKTEFSNEDKSSIVSIATVDSFGAIDRSLSNILRFSQELPINERTDSINNFLNLMQKIPSINASDGNRTNYLEMILGYADSIVAPVNDSSFGYTTSITTLENRKEISLNNSVYKDINEQAKSELGGMLFFDVSYAGAFAMEDILRNQMINKNKINPDVELPQLIFGNIRQKYVEFNNEP